MQAGQIDWNRAIGIPIELVALGAIRGLALGLVAVGLILAFRSGRALNLAHGQIGAFSAVAMLLLVRRWDLPYWVAFPIALAIGALLAALVEATIVRRLRGRPAALTFIATMGAGQLLLVAASILARETDVVLLFPQPPGFPEAELGSLRLAPATIALAVLGPVAVAALVLALNRTRLGLALRAAGDDEETARLAGLPARRLAAVTWGAAGALAALTAILVLPAGGSPTAPALGLDLLMRALAAAVLAGLRSLPVAMGASIVLGIGEEALRHHVPDPGAGNAALLAVLALGLVLRRPPRGRPLPPEAWSLAERWVPLPAAAQAVPLVRWAPPALAAILVVLAACAPLVVDAGAVTRLATIASFAIVGLSAWLLITLTGLLSLGQIALAGIGAAAAAVVGEATGSPVLGLATAPAAAAAAAVLLALPALRAGALGLAVLSLGWAFAAPWVLEREWALGDATPLDAVVLGPVDTGSPAGAYWLSLAALVLVTSAVSGLASGAWGRRLVAVRDNPLAARTFGLAPLPVRLDALLVAGALAGLGGALLAHTLGRATPEAFAVGGGLQAAAMALVGGLATAWGPLLGALYIVALPLFVPLDGVALAATAFGWLLLLLYVPGGLAAVVEPGRRQAVRALLRLSGHSPGIADPPRRTTSEERERAAVVPAVVDELIAVLRVPPVPAAGPVLDAWHLRRTYGAIRVLDDVSLSVGPAEAVAIVGPNGAGKTTLVDVICGLVALEGGSVFLDGADVTRAPADLRARRGVARSYQDGALFPTLTVIETVAVAAGGAGADCAAAALRLFGLEGYAQARVRTLSTGVRRLAELACIVARRPRLVLLDEPAAGLTAAEAAAFGDLLGRLRRELGFSLVVVEHDLELVAAVADRALLMSEGRIVAEGSPDEVIARLRGAEDEAAAQLGRRHATARVNP